MLVDGLKRKVENILSTKVKFTIVCNVTSVLHIDDSLSSICDFVRDVINIDDVISKAYYK